MKKFLCTVLMVCGLSGCAWWDKHGSDVVKGGLEASKVACILGSRFTTAPEIATACEIDQALVPEIEKLLSQPKFQAARKALREAPAMVPDASDAGK